MNSKKSTQSIPSLFQGIWSHLSRHRRIQMGQLLVLMLTSGVAELLSLGAVLPFLTVLNDPLVLWQQQSVQKVALRLGFTGATDLLLPCTLLFSVAVVLSSLVRLGNLWLNGRFAASVGSDLSCEAYRRTLYQPYEVHLQKNSTSLIKAVSTQITYTTIALNSFLKLVTSTTVSLSLLAGLLLIDAPIALTAATLFSGTYCIIAFISRRELRANSQKIADKTRQQLKALQEGVGAVRDILLDGTQRNYLKIYRDADIPQRKLFAKNSFLGAFPRYIVETIGMLAIALLGVFLVLQKGSSGEAIPILGALALGAQRLLPSLQQIYNGWATVKSYSAAMQDVLEMLNQPLTPQFEDVNAIELSESIQFKDVSFRYSSHLPDVLPGLDLTIRVGERIGIIGATGSGKSTMVDVLMGLLIPTSGKLIVDGQDVHDPANPERLFAWRAAIAHVPQSIYLADGSVLENIAFGTPPELIDLGRVRDAADQAQISNFIESSPDGYQTVVGERGIRLSGGQRQRIGIARALYKRAQVLILDEATSALDINTESELMTAVDKLSKKITIVMVAHRLSTIKYCDRVFRLENGDLMNIE